MKISLVNHGNRAEIAFSMDAPSFWGNMPVEEVLLVTEARHLRDQLSELIKQGEQINKPKVRWPW